MAIVCFDGVVCFLQESTSGGPCIGSPVYTIIAEGVQEYMQASMIESVLHGSIDRSFCIIRAETTYCTYIAAYVFVDIFGAIKYIQQYEWIICERWEGTKIPHATLKRANAPCGLTRYMSSFAVIFSVSSDISEMKWPRITS